MNMREIQKMQQRLVKMQEELEASQFTGTAGGGAVTITMNGKFELSSNDYDESNLNRPHSVLGAGVVGGTQ